MMGEECMSDHLSPHNLKRILAQPMIWVCAGIFLYTLASLSACKSKKGDTLLKEVDSLTYAMVTRDISSLISDSGITKYKLESPVWYTFEEPEAKWYFPEGLYVEQFDTLFQTKASIKADTAYYYQDKKLWELIGNVEVLTREGQRYYGHSLYWDESSAEVYSHEHTTIIPENGQLIESKYGFRSNQNMTRYELYSSSGHVDVEDKPVTPVDSLAAETAPSDSTSLATRASAQTPDK